MPEIHWVVALTSIQCLPITSRKSSTGRYENAGSEREAMIHLVKRGGDRLVGCFAIALISDTSRDSI